MEFLDKKERVFDIVLSQYGKHLLSKGELKPEFYAFFDDNIVYDINYASSGSSESQNAIYGRVKDETQYFTTNLNFAPALSGTVTNGGLVGKYIHKEDKSIFSIDSFIGDSDYFGDPQKAPAWNINNLENSFTSFTSSYNDITFNTPQLNCTSRISLKAESPGSQPISPADLRVNTSTQRFSDDKIITFSPNQTLFFVEEQNTENYRKNFDLEVYMYLGDKTDENNLKRLSFGVNRTSLVDGYLVEQPSLESRVFTDSNVEFFFDIKYDSEIDIETVCKHVNLLNKENISAILDYDCSILDLDEQQDGVIFYDIYGSKVEDDICQD
jgi:hypothetical protein